MQRATMWHNPHCSKSRAVLQILRQRGIEPVLLNYLAHPPDRRTLRRVASACGGARVLVRQSEPQFDQLALETADEDQLLDAMLAHPNLINRPVVITRQGARLCRPSERVLELLE